MTLPRYNVDFEEIELDGLPFGEKYKILAGSIVPRPIALISSLSPNGTVNLAPFSSFMMTSVEEGLLAISIGPVQAGGARRVKDTLVNIRHGGEFAINIVSEDMARQVQICAEEFEADESEAGPAGLALIPSTRILPPRVAESRIQFEMRLHIILALGRSHLVIGRIVAAHARKGIVRDNKVDPAALAPLGRLAGRTYCRVRDVLSA